MTKVTVELTHNTTSYKSSFPSSRGRLEQECRVLALVLVRGPVSEHRKIFGTTDRAVDASTTQFAIPVTEMIGQLLPVEAHLPRLTLTFDALVAGMTAH